MASMSKGLLVQMIREPFIDERVKNIISARQMFIMMTTKGIYYISKATPTFRRVLNFKESVKDSFLFQANNKLFAITISDTNILRVYTTIHNYQINFLMKFKIKKYTKADFFKKFKIVVYSSKNKIYVMDLKRLFLKKEKAYEGFSVKTEVGKVINLQQAKTGYSLTFVDTAGVLRKVKQNYFSLSN